MKTPETKNTAAKEKEITLNPAAKAIEEMKNGPAKAADPAIKEMHEGVAIAADPASKEEEIKGADLTIKPTAKTTKKTKKVVKDTPAKKVKVKILASNMAGKYLLPYNPGQIAELPEGQASEIIDAGDGTLATDKDLKA